MRSRGLHPSSAPDPIASAIACEYFSLLSDLAEQPDSPEEAGRRKGRDVDPQPAEPPQEPSS